MRRKYIEILSDLVVIFGGSVKPVVMPAQAGIHSDIFQMDASLRWHDEELRWHDENPTLLK